MARQRCILALFLVCTIIFLITIVSAFRLRDLQGLSSEKSVSSSRNNPLLLKCDTCKDSEHLKTYRLTRIAVSTARATTNTRTYEDVKKAVKVEQERVNKKKGRETNEEVNLIYNSDKNYVISKRTQTGREKDIFVKANKSKKDNNEDEEDVKLQRLKKSQRFNSKINIKLSQSDKRDKYDEKSKIMAKHKGDDSDVKKTKIIVQKKQKENTIKHNKRDGTTDENGIKKGGYDGDNDEDDDDENDEDEDDDDEDEDDDEDDDDDDVDDDDDDEDDVDDDDDDEDDVDDDAIDGNNESEVDDADSNAEEGDDNDENDDSDDDDEDDEINFITNKNIINKIKKVDLSTPAFKESARPIKKSEKIEEVTNKSQESLMVVITEEKQMVEGLEKKNKNNSGSAKTKKTESFVEHIKPTVPKLIEVEASQKDKENKRVEKESGNYMDILKRIYGVGKSENHNNQKQCKTKHNSSRHKKRSFDMKEFEMLYSQLPSFSPDFGITNNLECKRKGQILLRQLKAPKLWVLNMLDSSGKIPSGLLQGNTNQFGDFDQCLKSRARVRLDSGRIINIQGKYCLAQIEIKAVDDDLQTVAHLAQARNLIRNKIDDPGHFIPLFSILNWGLCMPDGCDEADAELILKDAIRHYNKSTGIKFTINVDAVNCHIGSDEEWWEEWLEIPTVVTLAFYALFIYLVFYATVKDWLKRQSSETITAEYEEGDETEKENSEQNENEKTADNCNIKESGVISAFSLYESVPKLFKDPAIDGEICCIHGIRAICSILLLLAHKMIPLSMTPYTNRVTFTEVSNWPISFFLRGSIVYTDGFLLLSGALSAYHLSADFNKTGSIPWSKRYFSRYIRLTPALAAVVLFYGFVWDKIGSGPQWGTIVTRNAELCYEGFLSNLLYVQNFFNFEDMCAPHTHQLALDMQLTLIAGIAVWLWNFKPMISIIVFFSLQGISLWLRYTTTLEHHLSLLIYHGAPASQLYRSASMSYISATHRLTPYITGLVLGLILQNYKRSLSKIVLVIGTSTAAYCTWCLVNVGVEASNPAYEYTPENAANITAYVPPASAFVLFWIILLCHTGYADFLNTVLCSRILVFVSRISYAMYLCQFIVFFTNVATIKSAERFNISNMLDYNEIAEIVLLSTAVTLTFVLPIQSIPRHLLEYLSRERQDFSERKTSDVSSVKDEGTNSSPIEVVKNEEIMDTIEEEEQVKVLGNYDEPRVFIAHRELLEELLEAELNVETEEERNRRAEGLEEILEEEEDGIDEQDIDEQLYDEEIEDQGIEELLDEEIEIINDDDIEGGEDDIWSDRDPDDFAPGRRFSAHWSNDSDEDNWREQESNPINFRYQYRR